MLPAFSITGLISRFFLTRLGKTLPPWLWEMIVIVVAVGGFMLWHGHAMHSRDIVVAKQAKAEQAAFDQKQADQVRAQARTYKQQLDIANGKIQSEEKARHEQTVAANRALADALRMRVNRAQVQSGSRGVANLPGRPAAGVPAGGPQPNADAAVGQGADRPVISVDANQLIDYAQQCDDYYDALIRTEDAQKQYDKHSPATPPPQ